MENSKENNNNMVEVKVMEVKVEALKPVKPQPKQRGRPFTSQSKDGQSRRLWISSACFHAMDQLKTELGLRSGNDVVHWLLREVRPKLVPELPHQPKDGSVNKDGKPPETDFSQSEKVVPSVKVPVRITAVQASTLFFDTPGTLDKAERLVASAAAYGSQLVVFPEAFIGGHPHCAGFDAMVPIYSAEMEDDIQKYYDSAIVVPGSLEFDRLSKIASTYKVHLVIGVVERTKCYLYSTVLVFNSLGKLLGKHRKQIRAAYETTVWYSWNKSSLPIYETSIGRIGVVISWDNKLPLLRSELYDKGVEIYCAPTCDSRSVWNASMVHIAREGGCFVLSANQFCHRSDRPLSTVTNACSLDANTCTGGSMIVSPSGKTLAGPNYQGECLISAEIELKDIVTARREFNEHGKNVVPDHAEVIEID